MSKIDYYELNYTDYEGIYITRVADDGYLNQENFNGLRVVKLSDYENLLAECKELRSGVTYLQKDEFV